MEWLIFGILRYPFMTVLSLLLCYYLIPSMFLSLVWDEGVRGIPNFLLINWVIW